MRKSRLQVALVVLALTLGLAGSAGAWIYNPTTGHYYQLTSVAMSWTAAETEAVNLGGHLATVNDAEENTWLVTNFTSSNSFFIGYNQPGEPPEPADGWVWVSGETPGYANWGLTEPNNGGFISPNVENCVELDKASGYLNDISKTAVRWGIIESPVPLPPTVFLLGSGLAGLAAWRRRRG